MYFSNKSACEENLITISMTSNFFFFWIVQYALFNGILIDIVIKNEIHVVIAQCSSFGFAYYYVWYWNQPNCNMMERIECCGCWYLTVRIMVDWRRHSNIFLFEWIVVCQMSMHLFQHLFHMRNIQNVYETKVSSRIPIINNN